MNSHRETFKILYQLMARRVDEVHDTLASIRESVAATAQAALRRRGARRVVQAKLVGAPDASPTVGRITEPEVPIDAFKSDLRRKQALRSVMGKPRTEDDIHKPTRTGILDDSLCVDQDTGEPVDCDDDNAVPRDDYEAERPKRRRSVAESAIRTYREAYGMAQQFGPPSEKPTSMDGLHGEELAAALAKKGLKLGKSDPDVDFAYAADPCERCIYFDGNGGCRVVSGLVTKMTTSKLFTPKSGAQATFQNEMKQ